MNELSLFSGAGGGVLGSKILGHRIVGYIEYEKFCQEILKQRIADGILDAAPIFGDIRKFISEGYAEAYSGMVDIITGGFPCQPFSVAGKGLGESDPRNMWPGTIACIRIIKPRFAFLENVPGLLQKPYFRRILREIAESGYDCRWGVLGASDVGANHRRKRLWILGYSKHAGSHEAKKPQSSCSGVYGISPRKNETSESSGSGEQYAYVADPIVRTKRGAQKQEESREQYSFGLNGDKMGNDIRNRSWWSIEPRIRRVAHGIPSRVDRLKALGNAQVPIQMAYAFQKLSEGLIA